METKSFTASNGITVTPQAVFEGRTGLTDSNGKDRLKDYNFLNTADMQALREFFRAERDEELGRWRWPENPDYMIIKHYADERYVVVLCESTALSYGVNEDDRHGEGMPWRGCARDYFAEHPVSKPWHDAKPGEVWLLTTDESTKICLAKSTSVARVDYFEDAMGNRWLTDQTEITAGRRIWPEA